MGDFFIVLSINVSILFLMFLYFRGRLVRFVKSNLVLDQIREEVDMMIIEMNQTTNRNIGLIEERLQYLSELTAKADKSILQLSRTVEQKKKEVLVYNDLKKRAPMVHQDSVQDFPLELTLNQRVLQMYKDGISKEKIAHNIDKTLGEVDLILSLELRKEV